MNDGKALERQTKEILRLGGYRVTTEHLLGSKKVDLLADDTQFGKKIRYAVECKDYKNALHREAVSGIYGEYLDLLEGRLIDFVLLITRHGISPSADAYVSQTSRMIHQTIEDLQLSVIDFSPYLAELVRSYEDDVVSKCYVAVKTGDDRDLEETVNSWLTEEASPPLAIMGSYGLGKTTFTRHIAARLPKNASEHASDRIPIVISLGLISSEQSLAGLLGKQFTQVFPVKNYNFSTFLSLVKSGKLIVFLDGFDEMKQCLSGG